MNNPELSENDGPAFSRRRLLQAGGLGAAGVLAATAVNATGAAATPRPGVRDQAPGYYRIRVGDVTVTAVSDGTFDFDVAAALLNITPHDLHEELERSFLQSPIEGSVNAYVVDTGRHRVLVDTGAGSYLGDNNGKLRRNLARAGYSPDDLDAVVFTHLHSDHIGGLVHDDRPVFTSRRTRILVGHTEAAYWLDPANEATAREDQRQFFEAARDCFAPYRRRLRTFRPGDDIVAGVTAESVPGHTPGHVGFRVRSKGEQLLIWGDVVHVGEVQFSRPGVAIAFDADPKAAVRERETLLRDVARRRYPVAGAHLPFPGFGHVRAAARGFEYVPLNYTTRLDEQS